MPPRIAPGFRIGASFEARFSDDGTRLVTLGKRITLWDVGERRRMANGPPLVNASRADFWFATVFDQSLQVRHRDELRYASDVHFSPLGGLVAFGDWSAGRVLAWPPRG